MATLRSFIALLLVGQWLERDLTGKPGPTFPDHAQKPEIRRRGAIPKVCRRNIPAQKGSPACRTGRTLCVAAQYIVKTPKNNGLLASRTGDFRPKWPNP